LTVEVQADVVDAAEVIAADARGVHRMLHDQRHPRRLEALWPAVRRLMSVRHASPSEVAVREVTTDEAERLELPKWISR
jgi:hypothetical protein